MRRQCFDGSHQELGRDKPGTAEHDPQPDARERLAVVALGYLVLLAVEVNRVERTARGCEYLSIRPCIQVLWSRFMQSGGV